MSEDILEIEELWPGTTIDGEPGIVTGNMAVIAVPEGGFLLSMAVGPSGEGPEDQTYVEFVLSPESARALSEVLGR